MSEIFLSEDEVSKLDPWSVPIDEIDVSQPNLFKTNAHFAFFERLRKEAPVHYCKDSVFGPFWSITRFNDIMSVDKDHHNFPRSEACRLEIVRVTFIRLILYR